MASRSLTQGDDIFISVNNPDFVPVAPETSNSINGLGGDDFIEGREFVEFIFGGDGNDTLIGNGGDDVLLGDINSGEVGDDVLDGGSGNDLLFGGAGNDQLRGGTGNDRLRGSEGDDIYVYDFFNGQGGIDVIADDLSAANSTGFGGGNGDFLVLADITSEDFRSVQNIDGDIFLSTGEFVDGDDLYITSIADALDDGILNNGVIITDFHLGGDNVIEFIQTADNLAFDITSFV